MTIRTSLVGVLLCGFIFDTFHIKKAIMHTANAMDDGISMAELDSGVVKSAATAAGSGVAALVLLFAEAKKVLVLLIDGTPPST
jgi:hypothetical protein